MPPRARSLGPLTWEEAREQIDYNPDTGVLIWKVCKPRIRPGRRAGYPHLKGMRAIVVCGTGFLEHRFIWFWMTGKDPGDLYIDHKNRNPSDNRWQNLRLATHGQNYINSKTFGPTRGIQKRGEGAYRVRITHNKIRYSYQVDSYWAAKRLRNKLERELYGEFACTRR